MDTQAIALYPETGTIWLYNQKLQTEWQIMKTLMRLFLDCLPRPVCQKLW